MSVKAYTSCLCIRWCKSASSRIRTSKTIVIVEALGLVSVYKDWQIGTWTYAIERVADTRIVRPGDARTGRARAYGVAVLDRSLGGSGSGGRLDSDGHCGFLGLCDGDDLVDFGGDRSVLRDDCNEYRDIWEMAARCRLTSVLVTVWVWVATV